MSQFSMSVSPDYKCLEITIFVAIRNKISHGNGCGCLRVVPHILHSALIQSANILMLSSDRQLHGAMQEGGRTP